MKKSTLILFAALVSLAGGAFASSVDSLRGGVALTEEAPEPSNNRQILTQGGIERSYKLQPPVIPHKIDKEEITLKINTCLKCHSEKTFEAKKAPKIGDSHYLARDGQVMTEISSRRYFCSQCHVLQLDASPLVENVFEGAR